ncbi:MAG: TetR/AcrR family transcriptional regulator [Actinomycetota bacterium]
MAAADDDLTTVENRPANGSPTRRRLQEAALELFQRNGYDAVTPTQIAAAAGVSERTFFRHFASKPESLMGDPTDRLPFFTKTLRSQPAELSPLEALLATIAEEERRFPPSDADRARGRIVQATPALADLVRSFESAIEGEFASWLGERTGRSAEDFDVVVVAAALVAVRRVVITSWIVGDDDQTLADLAAHALRSFDVRLPPTSTG